MTMITPKLTQIAIAEKISKVLIEMVLDVKLQTISEELRIQKMTKEFLILSKDIMKICKLDTTELTD